MDHADHVAAVERETRAMAGALRAGPLDAAVPSCPDWTLADLARHAGEFSVFWAHLLCDGIGRPRTPAPRRPDGDAAEVAGWYEELGGHLLALLREVPPDTEIWTWVDYDKTARFAARRAAHELSVHRFDAELAVGTAQPVDAALAADGIDEIFDMLTVLGKPAAGGGQTMHLHGTDRGDEWLVRLGPDAVEVQREHAKGDLALRGAVSDLELVLYGRPPVGPVERYGDEAVLDVWRAVFSF